MYDDDEKGERNDARRRYAVHSRRQPHLCKLIKKKKAEILRLARYQCPTDIQMIPIEWR